MARQPIPGERTIDAPGPAQQALIRSLSPYVRQTGDDFRRPWLLRRRRLLDYLLVHIAVGTGRFRVGEQEFAVGPGDIVWIPPDTPHEMEGYAPVMHCVYAHFDLVYDPRRSHWDACIPGGVTDLSQWHALCHPPLDEPRINSLHGRLRLSNAPAVAALLAALCVEHRRAPSGNALLLSGLMVQLVGLVLAGSSPLPHRSTHHQALQSALAFIHEHAEQEIDLGRLAQAAGLSQSHFRKLFREQLGRSPRAVHRQARIRKACELLVYNPALNISQVAFTLGFSTVQNFSRAFHEVTGHSPTEYRAMGDRSAAPPSAHASQ